MKKAKKGNTFSKFILYASYRKYKENPFVCFLASLVFNWGGLFLLSFLIMGILTAITGGNLLRGIIIFCTYFGGGQIVYPIIGLLTKGSDDAYGYSYGFYYGTAVLGYLFEKSQLLTDTSTNLLISAVIVALICIIVYLNRQKSS